MFDEVMQPSGFTKSQWKPDMSNWKKTNKPGPPGGNIKSVRQNAIDQGVARAQPSKMKAAQKITMKAEETPKIEFTIDNSSTGKTDVKMNF